MNSTNIFVPYEDYVTGFRVTATVLFILGAGSNITVVVISAMTKKDTKAFVLLMQIHACANALHSCSGWLSANRHPVAGRTIVFITYGTCSLFSPRFCAICDIVPTLSNSFIPALIATMMVFRVLIMYQFQLTKTVVLIVVGILVIVMSPLAVLIGQGYVDLGQTMVIAYLENSTDPKNLNMAKEIKEIGGYSVNMSGVATVFPIYNYISPIALGICLIFRLLMEYKHRQFFGQVSDGTKKIYKGFMRLLTLDALVELIYVCASQFSIVQKVSDSFPQAATFISFHNHTFFALPSVIQGLSIIYLVPYLRNGVMGIFSRKNGSSISVVTSSHGY